MCIENIKENIKEKMEEKKQNITDGLPQDIATVPYVVYEMAQRRNEKREFKHWIAHIIAAFMILLIVGVFVWLWNQYDTVSSVEATGVYALVDSSGNLISADIPTDKIPEILKLLEENEKNGNSQNK